MHCWVGVVPPYRSVINHYRWRLHHIRMAESKQQLNPNRHSGGASQHYRAAAACTRYSVEREKLGAVGVRSEIPTISQTVGYPSCGVGVALPTLGRSH